jgi:hypothetical protein
MNVKRTARGVKSGRGQTPEGKREPFSNRWWKLVIGSLLLSPLAVVAGDWYISSHSHRAAAVVHRAPGPGTPAALLPEKLKVSKPGDLLSDLETALDEGLSSPLVSLETTEQEEAFERFQEATSRARG